MELDHIFVFCSPSDGMGEWLTSKGFVETYRRQHIGQGTENICFCFNNAFVELLWVNDEAAVKSPLVARTALYERSRHLELGTCPFGISWRGSSEIPTWPYRPPYLAPPIAIDVATDSDDPHQPMMFRSLGNSPPSSWPSERLGSLQPQAKLHSVRIRTFTLPSHTLPSPALSVLALNLGFDLSTCDEGYRMDIEVGQTLVSLKPPRL